MKTNPRILRKADVQRLVGNVHATTLLRWERRGLFPRRVQFGPGLVGWYEEDITAWIEAKATATRPIEPGQLTDRRNAQAGTGADDHDRQRQ